MAKQMVGNIPENVTYFYSEKKKLESFWENDALHAGWVGQEVIPAFCSDAANEKTCETGRYWAERGNWSGKKVTGQEKTLKNEPISNIRIVSLEKRSEGGRAYKVVTSDNFYFDVREDVLMDTMIEVGIGKNGVLNGEFIWARVGAEMKLIRVGSALHKMMLSATADGKMKKLPFGGLSVGTIYQGKAGQPAICLGYVDYFKFSYERGSGYNSTPTYSKKWISNGLLMYDYIEGDWKSGNGFKEVYTFRTRATTSHAFIKEIGKVSVPNDILERVRIEAYKHLDEDIKSYSKYIYSPTEKSARALETFSGLGDHITMRFSGEPAPVLSPEIKKLFDAFPER